MATEPTELIVIQGDTKGSPISDTHLLYVTNTESDLFQHTDTGKWYALFSGRWLTAPSLEGPWQVVASYDLPQDFNAIPAEHPRGRVRVSIPGEPEAIEALILSHIPVKAAVSREKASLDVTYDGAPRFKEIPETDLAYAVNTPYDVVRHKDRYYSCYRAVWFEADRATGPWKVCDRVPSEMYAIPPSCPVYPIAYVVPFESDEDEVIMGYLGGYLGSYVDDDVLVYGTGYRYAPYLGKDAYYPWPRTWGVSVQYNAHDGGYLFDEDFANPYHFESVRAGYVPSVGWDHDSGDEHETYDVYASWPEDAVRRGGKLNEAPKEPVVARPKVVAKGHKAVAAAGLMPLDDIYTAEDGALYKHTKDGWSRFVKGGWEPVDPNLVASGQLHESGWERVQRLRRERAAAALGAKKEKSERAKAVSARLDKMARLMSVEFQARMRRSSQHRSRDRHRSKRTRRRHGRGTGSHRRKARVHVVQW